MKALSIQQPWADLIVRGIKDIENRSWRAPKTVIGKTIYVHAPRKIDNEACRLALQDIHWYPAARRAILDLPSEYMTRLGGIIGEVTITGCLTTHESDWFQGPFGFVLEDPCFFEIVIPLKGQRRFFEVDESMIESALERSEADDAQTELPF